MSKAFLYGIDGGQDSSSGGGLEKNFIISSVPPLDKRKIWIRDSVEADIGDIKTGILEYGPTFIEDIYTDNSTSPLCCCGVKGKYLYIFRRDKKIVQYTIGSDYAVVIPVTLSFAPDYAFVSGNDIYFAAGHKLSKFSTSNYAVTSILTSFGVSSEMRYSFWAKSGNVLYCFGGSYQSGSTWKHETGIYAYSIELGESAGLVGRMNKSLNSFCGCEANGKIYFFGGLNSNDTSTFAKTRISDAYEFDTSTRTLKQLRTLPDSGCFGAAGYIGNNKIIIASWIANTSSYMGRDMFIYDITANDYTLSSLKFPKDMVNALDLNMNNRNCGITVDEQYSYAYVLAQNKVYRITLGGMLKKGDIFLEYDATCKSQTILKGNNSVSLPFKKSYLGDDYNRAIKKNMYYYNKSVYNKYNISCTLYTNSSNTLTGNLSGQDGDRFLAIALAHGPQATEATLTGDGWTILNPNWANEENCIKHGDMNQYYIVATKVASSGVSNSITLNCPNAGSSYLAYIKLNNSGTTPNVAIHSSTRFTQADIANNIYMNEYSVTRPAGLVIWHVLSAYDDELTIWKSNNPKHILYSKFGSRQAIFFDQSIENAGKQIVFTNTSFIKREASIACISITGMEDFTEEMENLTYSKWKNIENGATWG